MAIEDGTLNKVEAWVDPAVACESRFQSTRLRVFANFRLSDSVRVSKVDVTGLAAPLLASSNPSIAALDVHGKLQHVFVRGVAPGVAVVRFSPLPGSTFQGQVNVAVSAELVAISQLEVFTTSALELVTGSTDNVVGVPAMGAASVSARTVSRLSRYGEMSSIVVQALLSDGTLMVVEGDDPQLSVTSDQSGSLLQFLSASDVESDDKGALFFKILRSSTSPSSDSTLKARMSRHPLCSHLAESSIEGSGLVLATMPTPQRLVIRGVPAAMVAPGDAASHESVGMPAKARLVFELEQAGGAAAVDVSNDPRLRIDDSSRDLSDLVRVVRTADGTAWELLTLAQGLVGSVEIIAELVGSGLGETSASLKIVRSTGVSVWGDALPRVQQFRGHENHAAIPHSPHRRFPARCLAIWRDSV